MPLPNYGSILRLRPEVRDPRLLLDMVDLGVVSSGGRRRRGLGGKGPTTEVLEDPQAFFDITFPTAEIVETLQTLSRRASAPESVPGTILLSGRYGQGKSHVLLAAHHALHAPDVARAWAQRWGKPGIDLPPDAIVITRSFIHSARQPLWQMLLDKLDPEGTADVGDFPDGQRIERLLGDRKVFLIMDELERWYDAQGSRDQSRNRNFLQALTEVSMRDGRITLLTSVLGEKQEPAETIRRVRPCELSFRSSEDRRRVVLFRLFENRHEPSAHAAAERAADTYLDTYRQANIRDLDGLRERMVACWPFTPEFLDILTKKVPNLGGFQNTRGTLRFLSHVVSHTASRRPIVSSQDLPFTDDEVHRSLTNLETASGGEVVRRALGDNYEAVPAALPHRDELFSTLVFYSVADPTHPGATLDELLLATLDPGENPIAIRDSLAQLQQRAFNLHRQDDRYVFLAVENPHARVNAMAESQQVTQEARRAHILAALDQMWGDTAATAVLLPNGQDALSKRLPKLRSRRPRFILSTYALAPGDRLRLQNLSDDRNLVILVEPRPRTSRSDATYSLFSDDVLVRRARRIEAANLLLEGRPAPSAASVYRTIRGTETQALRRDLGQRYGVAIAWRRAGNSTQAHTVDDSWYELHRLDPPTADTALQVWREDVTSRAEVEQVIRERWPELRTKSVQEISRWFDKNPGLPVPLEASWVPDAVVKLAGEHTLGLIAPDGAEVSADRARHLDAEALADCTLAEATAVPPPPDDVKAEPISHSQVHAQYDTSQRGVLIAWTYPPLPADGDSFRTLVQRYTTARSWEVGRRYPIDTGQTHEANRYTGPEDSFLDTDHLQPGSTYHYYVFLAHQTPDGDETFTLSRRCTVGVPAAEPPPPGVFQTGVVQGRHKLDAAVEALLMSGRHMTSDSRVRRVEVRIAGSTAGAIRDHLAPDLARRAGAALEASADINLVLRGSYSRQDIMGLIRLVPRYDSASYTATFHLEGHDTIRPARS